LLWLPAARRKKPLLRPLTPLLRLRLLLLRLKPRLRLLLLRLKLRLRLLLLTLRLRLLTLRLRLPSSNRIHPNKKADLRVGFFISSIIATLPPHSRGMDRCDYGRTVCQSSPSC
jgi:hypothetical protein